MSYYHHHAYYHNTGDGYGGEGGQQYAPTHYDQQRQGHDSGDATRLEALRQIIGESEPEEYVAEPVPLATATVVPDPGAVHRRRLELLSAAGDAALASEAEDAGLPAPQSTGRRRKKPGTRKGDYKEAPACAALLASRHRHRMRAEIDRCFSYGIGMGLTKAKRDALIAEAGGGVKGHDDEVDNFNGNEEYHDASGPREDAGDNGISEPLVEKDDLPFLPLFGDPSPHLSSLYDDVESALEDREESWAAVEEAHAEVEEARRRLRGALDVDASMKEALEEAKERAREAELEEPCKWNEMLRRMKEFHDAYGHTDIPESRKVDKDEDPSLYELTRFALSLRDRYKRGTLQRYPHRVKAVGELGFRFCLARGDKFNERMEALREFKEKHGHIDVRKEDDEELHRHVFFLRQSYRGRLGKEYSVKSNKAWEQKVEQLKELVDEDNLDYWSRMGHSPCEAIRAHRELTGHCVHPDSVVRRYIEDFRHLRRKKKEGCHWAHKVLSESKEKRLNEIGLCWTKRCTCKGAPENQDTDSEDDGDAGQTDGEGWAGFDDDGISDADGVPGMTRNRRRNLKRKRSLLQTGNPSIHQKAWTKKIDQLKEFKAEHGHCRVKCENNKTLYGWVSSARVSYYEFHRQKRRAEEQKRNGDDEGAETDYPQTEVEEENRVRPSSVIVPMTDERAAQLEEVLGDDIRSIRQATFDKMFKKWKEHKEREGNCVHPERKMKAWLTRIKIKFRERVRRKLLEEEKQEDGKMKEENNKVERTAGSETETEDRPHGKKKGSPPPFAPLKQWQIDLFNEAGICWGRNCLCSHPRQKDAVNKAAAAGRSKPDIAISPTRSNNRFDEYLTATLEHKKKFGSCMHRDKKVRRWFSCIKGRRRATLEERQREIEGRKHTNGEEAKEGDEPVKVKRRRKYKLLSDEQMAKLDGVDLCWGHGCQCPSHQSYNLDETFFGKPISRNTPIETMKRASSVTKTVADLRPKELERLAMGIIDELREREGWSAVECSSSDDSEDLFSSTDDSSIESGDDSGDNDGGVESEDEVRSTECAEERKLSGAKYCEAKGNDGHNKPNNALKPSDETEGLAGESDVESLGYPSVDLDEKDDNFEDVSAGGLPIGEDCRVDYDGSPAKKMVKADDSGTVRHLK